MQDAPTAHTRNPRHFNLTARLLHWVMAIAILAMLFIGVTMMSSLALRPVLIDLHQPLGVAILCLALVRLANRLCRPVPALPASVPHWQAAAAHLSHGVLYLLMIGLPLLGWAVRSAGNWPVILMGDWSLPALVPENPVLYAWLRLAHGALAWLLFAIILGHLGAALLHAWVLRDGVFCSMAQGTSAPTENRNPESDSRATS
ncbi:cytochrome b561 [Pseudomonas sp. URIL14HWK12:I8]|uniref:cytochrome b n=1 Tax=unclassified Pseudomonas TaxID=196821 RepID=UPI000408A787|nr:MULTISPECIES: cytochrome b [unclassified Pseudomonas]SNB80083.1 cytochrome b561 [Pseudomonas sp. URIL14HWK12:I8]